MPAKARGARGVAEQLDLEAEEVPLQGDVGQHHRDERDQHAEMHAGALDQHRQAGAVVEERGSRGS